MNSEQTASYLSQVIGDNTEALLAIREVPFFRECSDRLLRLVYQYGRIFSLSEGGILTRENQFDQWIFFVLSGKISIYVGSDRVDTISSSLVGERCLSGEPRKTTLCAAEEGITALGVDMALLDSLNGSDANSEDARVSVELLTIIAGEVINRFSDISISLIDITSKYRNYQQSEAVSEVISRIRDNGFQKNPAHNMEVYKILHRSNKALLAACVANGSVLVDTRKLYATCIRHGHTEILLDLAIGLERTLGSSSEELAEGKSTEYSFSFQEFAETARKQIDALGVILNSDNSTRAIPESEWKREFRLGDDMTFDLDSVVQWLQHSLDCTDMAMIRILTELVRVAGDQNDAVHGAIAKMVRELSQLKFISELESISANPDALTPEYFNTQTPENLIPLFSRHILDVHLVHPYLKKIGVPLQPEATVAKPETTPFQEDTPQTALLGSLFD